MKLEGYEVMKFVQKTFDFQLITKPESVTSDISHLISHISHLTSHI